MSKKIVAIMTSLILMVSMAGAVFAGAYDNDNTVVINLGLRVLIDGAGRYDNTWIGDYTIGTRRDFTTSIWVGNTNYENVRRELKIYGTGEISDFEFNDNGKWITIEEHNAKIIPKPLDENAKHREFHVRFNTAGRYVIVLKLYDSNDELLRSARYDMDITEVGIAEHEEGNFPGELQELVSSYPNIVTLDGQDIDIEGDTYTLPAKGQGGYNEKGYAIDGKNYKPGEAISVNGHIIATSIKTEVTVQEKSSIKFNAPTGIRFRADVGTNVTEGVETGMKISASDAPDKAITLANDGNATSFTAALVNINADNYTRKFVVKGYTKVTYADGDAVIYENSAYVLRSVADTAKNILSASDYFAGLTSEQQALINIFASAE